MNTTKSHDMNAYKSNLLKRVNKKLKKNNKSIRSITSKALDVITLDISRVCDRAIVRAFKHINSNLTKPLDSRQRKFIRLYLLGYPDYKIKNSKIIEASKSCRINLTGVKLKLIDGYNYLFQSEQVCNKDIMDTIISRYKLYFLDIDSGAVYKKCLKYIHDDLQANKYQLLYINVNADDIVNGGISSERICNVVRANYSKLSNYHNCVITFEDSKNHHINWNTIAKVAIYMENFKLETEFHVFKKRNKAGRCKVLKHFLHNNKNIHDTKQLINAVDKFYVGESYGFQFVDLFINSTKPEGSKVGVNNARSLVMQKVELNNNPRMCPACGQKDVRGNSYPRVLFRSFECQNPACPARSKSGRGKRFNELSAKRQIMLQRNSDYDYIGSTLYRDTRRDIVNKPGILNPYTMMKLYTWAGDKVLIIDNGHYDLDKISKSERRSIFYRSFTKDIRIEQKTDKELQSNNKFYNKTVKPTANNHRFFFKNFYDLPIVKLLKEVNNDIEVKNSDGVKPCNIYDDKPNDKFKDFDRAKNLKEIEKNKKSDNIVNSLIINDNSMNLDNYHKYYVKNKNSKNIKAAITSPPYYNARRYSQWENFLCYLIDMMIDAKVVYHNLDDDGFYIYNVGDIVDYDYVYIKSHMSKCRLMLGFYSDLLFNIVGFHLINNIIWDKGEVQSKRNSTLNHFAGYIKPINCYEHNLVFSKKDIKKDNSGQLNKVHSIPPVKKINSKGKNTYGHSAPFPVKIAELITYYDKDREGYILDPFLGSGTTCRMALINGYNSIGFELNKNYYQLSVKNVGKDISSQESLF